MKVRVKAKRVRIGGVWYRIVRARLKDDHGECDYSKALIRIDTGDSPDREEPTIAHELGHAAAYETGARYQLFEYVKALGGTDTTAAHIEDDFLNRFVGPYLDALEDVGLIRIVGRWRRR